MQIFKRAGVILKAAMLMLFLSALTGCWQNQVIVLPESQTMRIHAADCKNCFDGWLLSDAAISTLLEKAEKVCK